MAEAGGPHAILQGLVQQAPTNWTQYEPILVTKLPYLAQHPIASPSGKAVWKVQAGETLNYDHVDVVVCRFPEADGLKGIPDGTVTAYRCAMGCHQKSLLHCMLVWLQLQHACAWPDGAVILEHATVGTC